MINKPSPFRGLSIRIPIIIPIKERGFISQQSGLVSLVIIFHCYSSIEPQAIAKVEEMCSF